MCVCASVCGVCTRANVHVFVLCALCICDCVVCVCVRHLCSKDEKFKTVDQKFHEMSSHIEVDCHFSRKRLQQTFFVLSLLYLTIDQQISSQNHLVEVGLISFGQVEHV